MLEFLIAMGIVFLICIISFIFVKVTTKNRYFSSELKSHLDSEDERLRLEHKKRIAQFLKENNLTMEDYHKMFEGKCK